MSDTILKLFNIKDYLNELSFNIISSDKNEEYKNKFIPLWKRPPDF